MQVFLLEDNEDFSSVMDVLLQLRPSYNKESITVQIKKQMAQGYRVVYVKSEGHILAAAGFVAGEKLAWGKHIYIDDLITNESYRSKGAGALLIEWFKRHCKEAGYDQLHLDSGVQRFSAHRFYLRERFNIESHHFSITGICSLKNFN